MVHDAEPREGSDAARERASATLYAMPEPETEALRERHAHVSRVLDLCERLEVRVLVAGNLAFPANGLGSPELRPAVNLIVDPARCHDLVAALGASGWGEAKVRANGLLPPAVVALEERESGTLLNLFPLIPGFFADPQATFERTWRRRASMRAFGRVVAITDRLLTMVLSVHDNLGPRAAAPPPESETGPLIERFAALVTNDELERLPALVRGYGAEGVMRRLFAGLGLAPAPTRLPSRPYADHRFGIPGAGIGARLLLRALETSPGYPGVVTRDVIAARGWTFARAPRELVTVGALVLRARRARRERLRDALAAEGRTQFVGGVASVQLKR